MDIENDGKTLVGIIICSVLIVVVIIFTFVMSGIRQKELNNSSGIKEIINSSDTADTKELTENELTKLTDGFYRALYVYSENYSGDLVGFLKGFNNNQKLYMGNIIGNGSQKRVLFSEVRRHLINAVGSDLDVQAEDYYIDESGSPYFKYDNASGYYNYNTNFESGTDTFTDISSISIYNYKIKEIKDNVIYVYGLYKNTSDLVAKLENGRGLERYIGVDDMLSDFDYTETDQQYLENLYNNDISQFLIFEYHYEIIDHYFALNDFIVEN